MRVTNQVTTVCCGSNRGRMYRPSAPFVPVFSRCLPKAGIVILNEEFMELLYYYSKKRLDTKRLSITTIRNLDYYLSYYYEYFGNIQGIGYFHINRVIPSTSLQVTKNVVELKEVLYALDLRLKGSEYA